MKRVILTGATGYIGKRAIRHLLDNGFSVHAVTTKSLDDKTIKDLFWHRTNLLDPAATKALIETVRPTHLLHFAWYVEHGKFWNADENLDWLQASLYLAKTFVETGGKRMVTAGTCAEYDWTSKSPFKEYKTPWYSQTIYGASKIALSSTLEAYAKYYDFDFASGKYFSVYGEDESPNRLIPSVVRALIENKPAETSHGNQIRDFLFVEEIAKAFVALLESDVRGAVNIASGEGVRLKEIVREIAEIIGKPELLRIGALPSPQSEPPEIVADTTKLREEVGWRKEHNLKEGLAETVNYWKKYYEIYN